KRSGIVNVSLEGQKGTSRRDLMVKALSMGFSKLRQDGFAPPPLVWGSFTEDLFEPKVDITMQATMSSLAASSGSGITLGGVTALLATTAGGVAIGGAIGGVAGGAAAGAGVARPPVMPSVGETTEGLVSGKDGLSPPVRKRLKGLLAAAFRDPCIAFG